MGRKVSDEFTVPLCSTHHRELHGSGNEKAWWAEQGVDPEQIAEALWLESRDFRTTKARQSVAVQDAQAKGDI